MNTILPTSQVSRDKNRIGGIAVNSVCFGFGVSSMDNIVNEFQCSRSNEKLATVLRGCNEWADPEVANKLIGKKFLIHANSDGVNLPGFFGAFDEDVEEQITILQVNSLIETYHSSNDISDPDKKFVIKAKSLLKKIIMYCKINYVNDEASNFMVIEVTGQKSGHEVVSAIFASAVGTDQDLSLSMAQVNSFKMEDDSDED